MKDKALVGLILVTGLLMYGCVTIEVSQPEPVDMERSRVLELDYDTTWFKAVDWFADHDIPIGMIEKPSGLLIPEQRIWADESWVKCGEYQVRGSVVDRIEYSGSMNITVRPVTNDTTAVSVNFFAEGKVFTEQGQSGHLLCTSTGVFERRILDFIEDSRSHQ